MSRQIAQSLSSPSTLHPQEGHCQCPSPLGSSLQSLPMSKCKGESSQIGKFPAPPATMPEKQPHLGALNSSAWKERQKSGVASPIKRGKKHQGTLGHLHPRRKGQIISRQPCRYQISGLEGGHKNRRAKGLSLGFCLPSRMFLWTLVKILCFSLWGSRLRSLVREVPHSKANKQTKKNVSCYMNVVARE